MVENAVSLSSQFTGTPLKMTSKQIIQIQHNITGLKTLTGRRQPVGYFTSVAEDLN